MDILINGKSTDVGESLRAHVSAALEGAVRKYFDRPLRGAVTFLRDAHRFRADLTVHAVRGLVVQGQASADDAYVAFDRALERIKKQLRRYHRRLVNHDRGHADEPIEAAQQYVLAAEHENEVPAEAQPVVIAEMPTEIASATVGEAVMRMDLADGALPDVSQQGARPFECRLPPRRRQRRLDRSRRVIVRAARAASKPAWS